MARLASAAAGLAVAALVHAQGADELWQMTTRMEMEGMQMPAMSQQVCMKKGETRAEGLGQQDRNCKVTEQRRTANKLTWKVVCTGDEPMTGVGEMTRNRDTLEGRMLMKGKDGEMKIVYSGRLSGACNAQTHQDPQIAAAQQQVAAMQAQSNAQIAQMCGDAIARFQTVVFEMQGSPCLARKGEYCAHVKKTANGMRTPAGYRKALQTEGLRGDGWQDAARFCGVPGDQVLAAACKSAVAERDGKFMADYKCTVDAQALAAACKSGVTERDWIFVAAQCPAETQKLGAEHCAGREYTVAMSSEYKPLCAKYAGSFAQPQRAAAKPAAAPSSSDAVTEGVKEGVRGLRKLFGN
ncbi:MAG: DUF3617 domain-containing protein [Betaproteobacteria bacterium]|nr:DUF3617 domain-containing protein [Betaproteobacteria bacterium]MDH5221937.1 DUF3617 domain-containing protein [Betaproteobacteria bacterium]MDH5351288.1 DUF3617 domain-containing protein [Betaproteobacteria bacterium]